MNPIFAQKNATIAVCIAQQYPDTDAQLTLAERPERLHDVWSPLERILNEMERTGEIEVARNGRPVLMEAGKWYELVPALRGLMDFHELAAHRYQLQVDLNALRKLANKLDAGAPIFEQDLNQVRACIAQCKHTAASLTVAQAIDLVRTVQIKHALEH